MFQAAGDVELFIRIIFGGPDVRDNGARLDGRPSHLPHQTLAKRDALRHEVMWPLGGIASGPFRLVFDRLAILPAALPPCEKLEGWPFRRLALLPGGSRGYHPSLNPRIDV